MPETAPTTFSGELGAISIGGNDYAMIRNWKIAVKADNQAVVDSATSGGTTRLGGNMDWSGSFVADGHPDAGLWEEGVAFVGSIDGAKGAYGAIIVESVRVNIDISTGAPITHEVAFSGSGALTLGAAVEADASVATPVPSIGGKVELATPAAEQSYTELAQVQTITLELKRPSTTYADSSSAGYTKRKRGPLDWTCSIKVGPDSNTGNAAYGLEGLPQPKDVKSIKITDGNDTTWILDWGIFDDISDIEVNRETQQVVACTLNASMCGTTDIATVQTLGSIVDPAVATVWPEA
ncbi:MAG TPA: hypothetical protein VMY42_08035 [Thermoguttaceae bacterium]|nr:hypothetical protein [Thermoguttaceae bacterium]